MSDQRVDALLDAYARGEIGVPELEERLQTLGVRLASYNPSSDPDPRWADNNESRVGFTYCPYNHPKGRLYQERIKIAMIKGLDVMYALLGGGSGHKLRERLTMKVFGICTWYVHRTQREEYHADIYKFDDPRLQFIRRELQECILEEFSHEKRKCQFMLKALDIVLSLMKEDIYYRPRFLMLMQRIGRAYTQHPEMFMLTGDEHQYRRDWNFKENEDDFRTAFGIST